jgi:TorA maturation chaperone TorD
MAMRDPGCDRAIRAAGNLGVPSRRIGISSLSRWGGAPAGHVSLLNPEFSGAPDASVVDEIDVARAREYALLSVLLRRAPDIDLLGRLATLRDDSSPLGNAHAALREAAAAANVELVEREFFNLFISIGRGELVPYGSYYLSGFLNERPLARLRGDLARLGIERVEDEAEPEDHAAVLCEIMAGLAGGRFEAPRGSDSELFEKHLAPWIGHFFTDIERAKRADFYRPIGTLGRTFMEIESAAFALAS